MEPATIRAALVKVIIDFILTIIGEYIDDVETKLFVRFGMVADSNALQKSESAIMPLLLQFIDTIILDSVH